MKSTGNVPGSGENELEEEPNFFAGLTEAAAIVVARAGGEESGEEDALLLSVKVSDLVAEFVDLRSDHGENRLSGSALEGAKKIREDLVAALKILNAAILAADMASLSMTALGPSEPAVG